MEENLRKAKLLTEEIKSSNSFLIIPSKPVDFDCLGTALSVKWWLQKLGKQNIRITLFNQAKETLKDFPDIDQVKFLYPDKVDFSDFDKIILLDGSDWHVFFTNDWGNFVPNIDKSKFIHIDHHEDGGILAEIPENSITDKLSCTSQVFFKYFISETNVALDPQVATYMFYALVGDTGNFKHAINNDTFIFADNLMKSGADIAMASEGKVEKDVMEFTAEIILHTSYFPDAKSTILLLDEKFEKHMDEKYSNWKSGSYHDLYQAIFRIKSYDYFFIIRENLKEIRVNWRSSYNSKLEILKVLKEFETFEGGGHRNAGGGRIENIKGEEFQELLVKKLKQLID